MIKWLLGVWLVVLLAASADARPGGGHSYSGGGGGGGRSYSSSRSSSSGGGGGSIDGDALVYVLAFFFFVAVIAASVDRNKRSTYTSTTTPSPIPAVDVERMRARDPAFSRVAFEDFAFRLFAAAQRARGKSDELAALTPYFTPQLLRNFETASRVDAVVIGSLHTVAISGTPEHPQQSIAIFVSANLASATGTLAVTERWTLVRDQGVTSRPPETTRTLPCPNCNAPFQRGGDPRQCAHCGSSMRIGGFDWTVMETVMLSATPVGQTLTGTVQEVGTDDITKFDSQVYTMMQALYEADKNVTWDALQARLSMIYVRLNAAWNAHDLSLVRGLVTSSLLGYLQFWIDEYKRQQLHNKLESARIERLALARVTRDAYFDAITIRVFADGLDFTTDANGKVVGGSQSTRRAYSEYWTLIRSSARRGPVNAAANCPNCGAPLQMSDAGACTHCNAEVESGSFDWVLSKIEQDEAYVG